MSVSFSTDSVTHVELWVDPFNARSLNFLPFVQVKKNRNNRKKHDPFFFKQTLELKSVFVCLLFCIWTVNEFLHSSN